MLTDPNDLPALLDELAGERDSVVRRTREMFTPHSSFDFSAADRMAEQATALRKHAALLRATSAPTGDAPPTDDDVVPTTGYCRLSPALLRAITEPRERDLSVRACTALMNADLRSLKAVRVFLSEKPDGLLLVKNCGERIAAFIKSRVAMPTGDAPADDGEYPPITLNECDSFERHAEHGAKADPSGEGVEYALIQPYDLVRFCHTVRELRAQLAALRADREDAERWRWYAANADRWKLGYVALRGKWYCEGPDDALLDERFASAEEAIDAARRSQGGEPNV